MAIIKTDLKISISKEDKEFIKNKAEKMGYNTVSSYLIECAKNHFKFELIMSKFNEPRPWPCNHGHQYRTVVSRSIF